jgi:hypothetical protein
LEAMTIHWYLFTFKPIVMRFSFATLADIIEVFDDVEVDD